MDKKATPTRSWAKFVFLIMPSLSHGDGLIPGISPEDAVP